MDLFEYEGKQLMRQFEIPVPQSFLISSPAEKAPMEYPFVLKAQVMTGGRGKAGGVKICENEKDYEHHKQNIFNMQIKGHKVHGLLAEQMVKAEKELYLSITLQGGPGSPAPPYTAAPRLRAVSAAQSAPAGRWTP